MGKGSVFWSATRSAYIFSSWPGLSRPSRQGEHRAFLSGMPGTRPGMTELLLRRGARGTRGAREIIHRGLHAALAVRHAGEREAHLDPRERADDREIVGVAQMPDAEHLAGDLREASAKRAVEMLQRGLAECIRIVPGRHHDRCERGGIMPR